MESGEWGLCCRSSDTSDAREARNWGGGEDIPSWLIGVGKGGVDGQKCLYFNAFPRANTLSNIV